MILLATLWMVCIFIATCTNDVGSLVRGFKVAFTINPTPTWTDFSFFYPIHQISMIEMIGHFLMFLILTFLLTSYMKLWNTLVFTATYAILTEILQLYFGRGAEVYDVMANMVGILVGLMVIVVIRDRVGKVRESAMTEV